MKYLSDLLNVAIQQEIRSQELYRRGMEIVTDKETKVFLKELADEEVQHEKLLVNVVENGLYDLNVAVSDLSIFEPDEASHGPESLAFKPEWKMEEILELALKREFRANQLFQAMAATTVDQELKTLFNKLAEEEINHHRAVEKKYNLHKGLMGPEN